MHIGVPVPPWRSVHRASAPWEGGSGTSELSRWAGLGGPRSCTQNLWAAAQPLPRLPQVRRVSVQASCGASARAAQGPGPPRTPLQACRSSGLVSMRVIFADLQNFQRDRAMLRSAH